MPLARVEHVEAERAGRREDAGGRLEAGAREREVVAHRVDVAAGPQKSRCQSMLRIAVVAGENEPSNGQA